MSSLRAGIFLRPKFLVLGSGRHCWMKKVTRLVWCCLILSEEVESNLGPITLKHHLSCLLLTCLTQCLSFLPYKDWGGEERLGPGNTRGFVGGVWKGMEQVPWGLLDFPFKLRNEMGLDSSLTADSQLKKSRGQIETFFEKWIRLYKSSHLSSSREGRLSFPATTPLSTSYNYQM